MLSQVTQHPSTQRPQLIVINTIATQTIVLDPCNRWIVFYKTALNPLLEITSIKIGFFSHLERFVAIQYVCK